MFANLPGRVVAVLVRFPSCVEVPAQAGAAVAGPAPRPVARSTLHAAGRPRAHPERTGLAAAGRRVEEVRRRHLRSAVRQTKWQAPRGGSPLVGPGHGVFLVPFSALPGARRPGLAHAEPFDLRQWMAITHEPRRHVRRDSMGPSVTGALRGAAGVAWTRPNL